MPHPTEFKLYWEIWEGYANPDKFFAGPTLIWVIASTDTARRCLLERSAANTTQIAWTVNWEQIPYSTITELSVLLEEAGAHGSPKQLVDSTKEGDYLTIWDLTCVVQSRPSHLSVRFTTPGEQWSDLAQRLNAVLSSLRSIRE